MGCFCSTKAELMDISFDCDASVADTMMFIKQPKNWFLILPGDWEKNGSVVSTKCTHPTKITITEFTITDG